MAVGIVPPLSFLIASIIVRKEANRNFPYGFHRIVNLSYLVSSLSLLILGGYLLIDGLSVLLKQEHPNIPMITVFGHTLWMGNIMIIALLWSSVPSSVLGHLKLPLTKKLYDKILYADAKMNKASWTSGFASILGILGIGLGGFWGADALAGILISVSILWDGYSNVKQSLFDLLDEVPKKIGKNVTEPMIAKVKTLAEMESWVKRASVRFRDEGHVFFGDIFVVPNNPTVEVKQIVKLRKKIEAYHWRLHDVVITLVEEV